MKNKKKLFGIIGIVLVVVIIIILIINYINKPEKLDNILIENEYELIDEFPEGSGDETITFTRNTYKYQKGDTMLMVYEYTSLDEIKEEMLNDYERESKSSFEIKFENEKKYIYKVVCDSAMCFYNLGYENELVSTIVDYVKKSSTDELFEEIMKERNLK